MRSPPAGFLRRRLRRRPMCNPSSTIGPSRSSGICSGPPTKTCASVVIADQYGSPLHDDDVCGRPVDGRPLEQRASTATAGSGELLDRLCADDHRFCECRSRSHSGRSVRDDRGSGVIRGDMLVVSSEASSPPQPASIIAVIAATTTRVTRDRITTPRAGAECRPDYARRVGGSRCRASEPLVPY